MAALRSADDQLPSRMDLSSDWPVEHSQGHIGACVAFASTAAMEFVVRSNAIIPTMLSPRFVYYNARVLVDRVNAAEDSGTLTSSTIKTLKEHGAAPEV